MMTTHTRHPIGARASMVLLLLALGCGNVERTGAGEEEFINEVTLSLVPVGSGVTEVATIMDNLDGTLTQDRPLELVPGTTYDGSITLTNSTVLPPIDITQEVIAESDEHRFFYTVIPATAGVTVTNLDLDSNGVVFGQAFQLVVDGDAAGTVAINVILSHFDDQPKGDGSLPGNETDLDVDFSALMVD